MEREAEERTAGLLGLTREDVTHETQPALQALGQACLRHRLAASDDPRCQDFRRLIEESVRPNSPRHSADLRDHMTYCPHCTAAYEELSALRDTPRTALAEGLLPWSGTAYARDAQASPYLDFPPPNGSSSRSLPSPSSRRRFALASAVLGVTLVPLLIVLLSPGDDPSTPQGAAGTVPVSAVPSRPEATAPDTSPPPATKSPSPSPTSRPPTTPARSRARPPRPDPRPRPHPCSARRGPSLPRW